MEEEIEQLRADKAALQQALEAKDAEIVFLRTRLTNLRMLTEELATVLAEQPGLMSPRRQVPRPPAHSTSPDTAPPGSLVVAPQQQARGQDSAFPGIKLRRETVISKSAGKLAHVSPPKTASPSSPSSSTTSTSTPSSPAPTEAERERPKLKKGSSLFRFGRK